MYLVYIILICTMNMSLVYKPCKISTMKHTGYNDTESIHMNYIQGGARAKPYTLTAMQN